MRFEPIAIVGRSCVLPDALDPGSLWQNVRRGHDALRPAPAGRWRLGPSLAMGRLGESTDRTWTDVGGHVRGFERVFDPSGFRLPADEVRALDPVFQWTLHGVREALRDAAREGSARTGLVLGNLSFPSSSMAQFVEHAWLARQRSLVGGRAAELAGVLPVDARNRFTSGLPALLAAKALALGAGAFALDAACASSLYAIKLACDRLHDGTADTMIAGAVNAADDLFIHVGFCALSAMSRTGRSRPFHRDADGLVPAEGAAFVVLRRLSDALAAKERIFGVIRGIGLSNDGRGRGLLAPSEDGQVRAMRAAWEMAGLDPRDVGFVECHATGTPVGDATELRSMTRVFEGARDLPIGSLKSNLGHLVTAAGAAGLLKVLAAMEKGERPLTLHATEPLDELSRTPFRVVREVEPWTGPRRAAVSAFGFGGNNAHLVVEAWEGRAFPARAPVRASPPIAIVAVGARVGTGRNAADFAHALASGTRDGGPRETVDVDAEGLRFPPRDLEHVHPQQLLALEAAREAAARVSLPRERTAVLVGMGCDPSIARYGARWRVAAWAERWAESGAGKDERALTFLRDSFERPLEAAGVVGTMPNMPANRVNSQLDLGAFGFTVSAEEQSGVIALELAARALEAGEIDAALVGAADLSHDPVHLDACRALGLARPPGDAAVALVVKRLEDARRDGDPVLAVVESIEKVSAHSPSGDSGAAGLFGHAHAASGLVEVAAAALSLAHRLGSEGSNERAELSIPVLEGIPMRVVLRAGDALALGARPPPPSRVLRFSAHRPPVELSALDAEAMLPAPRLPSMLADLLAAPPRAMADDGAAANFELPPVPVAPAAAPTRRMPADVSGAISAFHEQLATIHRDSLTRQAELHARFLANRQAGEARFLRALELTGRRAGSRGPLAAVPPSNVSGHSRSAETSSPASNVSGRSPLPDASSPPGNVSGRSPLPDAPSPAANVSGRSPFSDASSPAATVSAPSRFPAASTSPANVSGRSPFSDASSPAATVSAPSRFPAASPANVSGRSPLPDAPSPAANVSGRSPFPDASPPAANVSGRSPFPDASGVPERMSGQPPAASPSIRTADVSGRSRSSDATNAPPARLSSWSPPAGEPHPGPKFDRAQLEVLASGRISSLFGPAFAAQDGYRRQVRMPRPPLLLADRVTGIRGEPASMKTGTIWTETDVRPDAWYLGPDGRMPAGVMIESGQADLLLISWLGADLLNRGERVYRLLGCELTYHGELPKPGETLAYDIHVDGHATQGDVRLFFFHYDCRVNGELRLSVRHGQAGFFTDAELAASGGVLWDPKDERTLTFGPLERGPRRSAKTALGRAELEAFADGRTADCFGEGFEPTRAHVRTPRVASGRMLLPDEVAELDFTGGPWERGYLRAEQRIAPDDWFFDGHFQNDPCMPGTLMFEGCLQAMAIYLAAQGFTIDRDGWRFEPVADEKYLMRCRGQVVPTSRRLTYEVFVRELHAGPTPTLYADLLCTVDGLKAFHARRVGLRLVPDWPLDHWRALGPPAVQETGALVPLERLGGLVGVAERGPVAEVDGFRFDHAALLASAWGRPSDAFGPFYARFDSPRRVARLPGPPYHFVSRIERIDARMGAMAAGGSIEAAFDVPERAWFFEQNGAPVVPFAVLMEAALQPCGWFASFAGCTVASDRDLLFRNLDGTATVHREIPPGAGPLTTRVRFRSLSQTAGMTIVSFDVECSLEGERALTLRTVFGFFPPEAFEDQAGLPATDEERRRIAATSRYRVELPEHPFTRAGPLRLAGPMLRMIDRITAFDPSGGRAGLGWIRAEKDVDPEAWFFKSHFFQDPVQPGSLGIEALIQLLQFHMLDRGLGDGFVEPRFAPLMLERALTWKYRGQVVPTNRLITTELDIVETGRDERGAYAVADGFLWVDGRRIYHAKNLGMRIVEGGGANP